MKLHAELLWDVFMQCMYTKKHFQCSLFHACCTFFFFKSKILGGLKRTKVPFSCGEVGGEEGFGIPAGEGLQREIKMNFLGLEDGTGRRI